MQPCKHLQDEVVIDSQLLAETLLLSVSSTLFPFSSARGESEAERDGRRSTSARRQPGMVGERALGRPAARAR